MKKTTILLLAFLVASLITGYEIGQRENGSFVNSDNSAYQENDDEDDTSNVKSKEAEVESITDTKTLDSIIQMEGCLYSVTNGNTGEQIELTEQSDQDKLKGLIGSVVLQEQEDTAYFGYYYAVKIMNDDGQTIEQFCITPTLIQISGKTGYYVKNTESLISYLSDLFD